MNSTFNSLQLRFRGFLACGITALLFAPAYTVAQQSDAGEQAATSEEAMEEVVVTGTQTGTGIRGVAPAGAQTIVVPRFELLQSPVRDAAEIIRDLPQGSQIGSGVADGDGGNDGGESGLNLRGLGGNASLILLDGHRMAPQGVSSIGPDPSAIPVAAIQTVEVVMGGASSIYGSDAVAGVVNYIMRDTFEGLDIQYSGLQGDFNTNTIEILGGISRGNFNIMLGGSYSDQDEFWTNERGYLMEDLRPYGYDDFRHRSPTGGNLPIFSIGGTDYVVPEGWVGQTVVDPNDASRTFQVPLPSEIVEITDANADQYLGDRGDYTTYSSAVERKNLFMKMNYEPTDSLQLSYTGLYSKREVSGITYRDMRVRVEPESAYWIPGWQTSNYTFHTNYQENGLPVTADPYVSTINHYFDLRLDIGEWQMNTSVFYGRTHGNDINRSENNNAALTHDPAGTPDGYLNYTWWENDPEWYNPYYTDEALSQPDLATKLVGWTWRFADQHLQGFNTRFEGPIFELPGGAARLNVGFEFSDADHWLGLPQTVRYYPNPDLRMYWLRDTDIDRRISSLFGELYLPLLSDVPGVQRLSVNLSARYDEYSDFGDTTNPRLGITWDVNDSLSFRANASEAFRAPTLTQMNPGVNSVLSQTDIDNNGGTPIPVTDPVNNESHIFSRSGRTPTLGPETAKMWGVGFTWTPAFAEGLRLAFDYYDVEYEDRIEALPNWQTALSSPENYNRYAPYIYPVNQPATCVAGNLATYDPALTRWLDLEGTRFAGDQDDCLTVMVLDRGEQNVGSLFQTGFDVTLSYDWDTSIGSWRASVNVAEILDLDRSLIAGGERFSILDLIGWQNSRRSNVRLAWANSDWSASLTAKIEGKYFNDQHPDSDRWVPSWTTYDMMVRYQSPQSSGMWSGVTFGLGAQNITDEDPPIVLHNRQAFDSDYHNPYGRMLRVELGKRFE